MKKRFFFLSILITLTGFSQTRQSLLSAALQNSNANDSAFFLRDSVLGHISYDAEADSILLDDAKRQNLITQADLIFMTAQLKAYKPHTWTADSIPHAQLIPSAQTPPAAASFKKSIKAWSAYFKTHKSGYYDVSEPVFSKDGNTAIVYVSFQCGANCGNGGAALYRFEKGAWIPVKNLSAWAKQPH